MLTTEEDIKNQDSCRISPEESGDEQSFPDLKNLDGLDKGSLLAVVLLVCALVVVLLLPASEELSSSPRNRRSGSQVVTVSAEALNRIAVARKLVTNNTLDQAEEILAGLMKEMPYEGAPYMLMGDILVRRDQPIQAMLQYRKGVDLNPDFLDKKMTDVFQGKKIKLLLNEVKIAIDAEVESGTVDRETISMHKDVLYYMLRKIAGSCG